MMFFRESRKKAAIVAKHSGAVAATSAKHGDKLEILLAVCRANLRSFDSDLIERAFYYAKDAHEGQLRDSGDEYFLHPIAVAMIVAQEIPLDDVSVASALLHDVIEDCEDQSYEDIQKAFTTPIADIVDGATKISTLLNSREVNKAENYRKLLISMVKDIRVVLVKFADRLHNMRTLEHVPPAKQQRIAKETLEIYAPLAHRFGLGRIKWELEDLSFKCMHPDKYVQLKDQLQQKRRDREDYLARFIKPIRYELDRANLKYEISSRPKHLYSVYQKMLKNNKTIDEIYDLLAVRIIIDTEEEKDCYLAYAIVCELFTPIPERYKNFIALPKQNGYKSIHTTMLGQDGKMVEVQIRTRNMHEVAEKGIAAHWAYKESQQNKKSAFENWIRWVREILEAQSIATDDDSAKQLIESIKSNLFQEEIVVFTPKGELRVLPAGATPVDFAFEIHSEVGLHCIGAKVNGRIVPLNRKLRSGDQIEVITSRNQYISTDWEQSVVTSKAKNSLRKLANEQTKLVVEKGKERWERKIKRLKLHITDEQLHKAATALQFSSMSRMFAALGNNEIDLDDIVSLVTKPAEEPQQPELPQRDQSEVFEQFAMQARNEKGLLIQGEQSLVQYDFARCCSPLPGDEVIGFVTQGRGIKIHRRNCRNIQRLINDTDPASQNMRERLVDIAWPSDGSNEYLSGIRIEGDDRQGILNEIALAITNTNKTNIRSVNIETHNNQFFGSVLVLVKNLDHLRQLIDRIKKVRGVTIAERYIEVT